MINTVLRSWQEQRYNVAAASNIRMGDFLWWDGTNGTLKSVGGAAANLVATWASLAVSRRDATSRFVGIANFEYVTTDTTAREMLVRSNDICEVNVSSSTYKPGDLLGFKQDGASNWLSRDTLAKVDDPRDAIAEVCGNYSTATTKVDAIVYNGKTAGLLLGARVQRLPVAFHDTQYSASAGDDLITGYTFGMPVKLLAYKAHISKLTAGACTLTIKNTVKGTLDDTLTIPDASVAGTVVSQTVDDALNYDVFEHDDGLTIETDGVPTAGAGTIFVEYMPLVYQL